jgi:hypothetical protein
MVEMYKKTLDPNEGRHKSQKDLREVESVVEEANLR